MSVATLAQAQASPRTPSQDIPELAQKILAMRGAEQVRLERISKYVRGKHDSVYVPNGAQQEFRWLRERSVVNFLPLIVATVAQNLHVDGFRPSAAADITDDVTAALSSARDALSGGDTEGAQGILADAHEAHLRSQSPDPDANGPWRIWQANRMGSRQHGLHRAVCTYGIAYAVVLPGDPQPVIRPVSPRRLTALYADDVDDEWPVYAVEESLVRVPGGSKRLIRLYDENNVYVLTGKTSSTQLSWPGQEDLVLLGEVSAVQEHGLGVCPVVRFMREQDLDGETDVRGEVEPLIPLQDQLNTTTFNLLMAQQYGAFKQRWVTGMVTADEDGRPVSPFQSAVERLWAAEDPDTKFGEFGASDLSGYLKSAEATIEHMSTVAQLPPYYLLGTLVNLSSDALAATRDALDRKVEEMQGVLNEPYKQTLRLASKAAGDMTGWDDLAGVIVWRDTGGKAFAAQVDGLAKMVQMMGIPATELWERIPGVSADDVSRFKAAATKHDALAELDRVVEQQMTKSEQPTDNPSPDAPFQPPALTRTPGV